MKSLARNLLLDLTFGPSFKVKQWFTGFGELSFRWIQIWISELDYLIKTHGHRKSTQFCHINMLKPYFDRSMSDQVLVLNDNTVGSLQNLGEFDSKWNH